MPSRSSRASAQPAPDRPGGSDAPVLPGLVFDNHYARLPDRFFVRMDPVPVAHPALVAFNADLAAELGLDAAGMELDTLAAILSGNRVPHGAEPLAQAYAGHQFGQFVPQLGDGRAILLGEVIDRAGRRRDLQLKGAGRTPFSRRGDGRAALGPVLREFVVSEAMHALGVPTTRALAAVTTGEAVQRETALPGAVLTRVAASHIRVGTFQFFAARGDVEALRLLLDHAIARHAPEAAAAEHPARAFLEAVAAVQADLIARWMGLGFIHGVMNTDNMTVSGETIDYGPCAFLDAYDPGACFSAIDQFGRYAYANQPRIAQWNLARLAEALLPLLDPDPNAAIEAANVIIAAFAGRYEAAVARVLRAKFGLTRAMEGDAALLRDGLAALEAGGADFTLAFRRLADLAAVTGDPGGKAGPSTEAGALPALRVLFTDAKALDLWLAGWRERIAAEPETVPAARAAAMRLANPARIPRNHRVEEALSAAVEHGDLAPFERLRAALARPFEDDPAFAEYAAPPRPSERVCQTFCGT